MSEYRVTESLVRGAAIGFLLGVSFTLVCVGWAVGWNVYVNVSLSAGWLVLVLTALTALSERERRA